jgi:hypothetical protein
MKRGVAMLLVAGVAVLVIAFMSTAVAGQRVTVRDSTHKYKYKPTSLYFAYRALFPPFRLTKLRYWVSWNDVPTVAAESIGWLHYDDCKPNCAEGHYRRKRAYVTLYGIHRCHGRRVFGKVRVKPRHLPAHRHRINCRGLLK